MEAISNKQGMKIDVPSKTHLKKSTPRAIPIPNSPIIYGQSMNTPNSNTPDFPNSNELFQKIYSNYLERLNSCPLSI